MTIMTVTSSFYRKLIFHVQWYKKNWQRSHQQLCIHL